LTMRWLTSVTADIVKVFVAPLSWPFRLMASVRVTVRVAAVIVVAMLGHRP